MPYAVYITRGDHWSFESREGAPIAKAEWLEYVANDPEFRPAPPGRAWSETGESFAVPMDGFWQWTAHPERENATALFQFLRAGVIVRAPDDAVLRKAKAVAEALKAHVIGDDGERYS